MFYLEAEEHDTLVRTARAEAYRSTRRLPELLARLPRPSFFCHEKYVVNLARVRSIKTSGRDRQLRLDPPLARQPWIDSPPICLREITIQPARKTLESS